MADVGRGRGGAVGLSTTSEIGAKDDSLAAFGLAEIPGGQTVNAKKMLRVSKRNPCPVCGRPDWCGVSSDGAVCICMRIEEGAIKQARNGGWVHRLLETNHTPRVRRVRKVRINSPNRLWIDFGRMAAEFAAAVNITELQDFADELGLSVEGLVRLGIGWCAEHRAWSFPMRNADLIVRGIRLRSWAGRKWAIKGSHDGLFLPSNHDLSEVLVICEGPTDAAAVLDLGFNVAGRPSCTGGMRLLIDLVKARRPGTVVIVRDADGPGRRGAKALASALLPYVACLKVTEPPSPHKDMRVWKLAGATHNDVAALIDATSPNKLSVRAQRSHRIKRSK